MTQFWDSVKLCLVNSELITQEKDSFQTTQYEASTTLPAREIWIWISRADLI